MLLVVESSMFTQRTTRGPQKCRPLSNYTTLVEFNLEIVIFLRETVNSHGMLNFYLQIILSFFFKWSRLLPSLVRRAPMTALVSSGWSRYTKRISFHFLNKIVLKNVLNMFFCEFNREKISVSVVSSKTIQSPASLLRKTPGNVSKLEHLRS